MNTKLFEKLKELSQYAYVHYSNFHVVAYFENDNDDDFYGINIENAAYPNTMCAERVGIHSAIKDHINISQVKRIHIFSPDSKDFLSPCGGCRQTLSEHIQDNCEIIMYNNKGEYINKMFSEIFPLTVNKENIKGAKK